MISTLLLMLVSSTTAFVLVPTKFSPTHIRGLVSNPIVMTSPSFSSPPSSSLPSSATSTTLYRQWNFNNDSGPFGLKNNAEIWNGRVAQMAIVVIIIQELITGKGVVTGLQEGNWFNLFCGLGTVVSVVGLTGTRMTWYFDGKDFWEKNWTNPHMQIPTGWLALKGDEDDIDLNNIE